MKNYSIENCIICNAKLIGGKDYKYCTCDDYSIDLTNNGKSIGHVNIDFYHRSKKYNVQISYIRKFFSIASKDKLGDWGQLYALRETPDYSIEEWKHLIDRVKKLKEFE